MVALQALQDETVTTTIDWRVGRGKQDVIRDDGRVGKTELVGVAQEKRPYRCSNSPPCPVGSWEEVHG